MANACKHLSRFEPRKKTTDAADKLYVNIASIALDGMNQAQARFDQTARRLASIGARAPAGMPADPADLSTDMVSLISARNQFATNLQVARTAGEMERQAIDLLA